MIPNELSFGVRCSGPVAHEEAESAPGMGQLVIDVSRELSPPRCEG